MKKLLIILLSVLSLTAVAQQKSVAVLEPVCKDNSVKSFYLLLIRGEMESAITSTDEYSVYDRTAVDKIMEEQNFQRSGLVKDDQIKRLGEMVGVDYVLISEVSADEGYMTFIAKILNVETGQSTKSQSELMEMNAPNVKNGCLSIATKLFGNNNSTNSAFRVGELLLDEGRYVGEIRNGKPHGEGKLTYKDSDREGRLSYDGSWQNGIQHGAGTMIWKSGSKYEGDWDNYVWNGQGKYYDASTGQRYEGRFKNDEFNGKGTWISADGDRYVGDFVNGKFNGQGVIYYADGRQYEGHWKDNYKSGNGKMSWPNGMRYEGMFEYDMLDGYGTIFFSNGNKHVGYCKNGVMQGQGTHYMANGDVYIGTWNNDKKEGLFTLRHNGVDYTAYYVNGQRQGEWIQK